MSEINKMYFSREAVRAGELNDLLNLLMTQSYGKSEHKNDIHIYAEDCGAFILEWANIPWDKSYGGRFEYIAEGQCIMLEKELPDGTIALVFDEEEYKDQLTEFLKEHPEYKQNQFGRWYTDDDLMR